MRRSIRLFVELTSQCFVAEEPIYEFGSWQPKGQEELANLRSFFEGKEYVGCDMREGKGVDKVLDLHHIELPDASVGTIISCDTLEHVEYPRKAISEIHRILKANGFVILTSVMNFPIHGYPNDYWRFTPEGFRSLLSPFENVFVGAVGLNENHPQTVLGLGFKGEAPDMEKFNMLYEKWHHRQIRIAQKLRDDAELGIMRQ